MRTYVVVQYLKGYPLYKEVVGVCASKEVAQLKIKNLSEENSNVDSKFEIEPQFVDEFGDEWP